MRPIHAALLILLTSVAVAKEPEGSKAAQSRPRSSGGA
jgi:hypothetical protein